MTSLVYQYPTLHAGILLKRYKRFFVDVELPSGEIVVAHCPNTGPMTGVCTPGSTVYLSYNDNPARKLRYTLEMIAVNDNGPAWAGVNTSLPNRVMQQVLAQRLLPELGLYQDVRCEVPYGQDRKSRIDFLLTGSVADKPIYLEVKNTTWVRENLAMFPDTVTTRGQKHLRELIAILPQAGAVMLYFINRGDCPYFAPGDSADPAYGKLLREAIAQGVQVLPCRFDVSPTGIRYLGLAELKI